MPQIQQRKNNKKKKQNNVGKIVAGLGGAAVAVGVGGGMYIHHIDSTLNKPAKNNAADSDSYQDIHFTTPSSKKKNKVISKKEQSEANFNEDVNTLLGKTPQQIKAENVDFEKNVADLLSGVSTSSSNNILNDLLVNSGKNTNSALAIDSNIDKLIAKSINADQALLNVVNTVDSKQNTNSQQNTTNTNNQDNLNTALDKLLNHNYNPFAEIDNDNSFNNVTYHPANNANNTTSANQNNNVTPVIPSLSDDNQLTNKTNVDSTAVIHSSVVASQVQPAHSSVIPIIPSISDAPLLPDSAISHKPVTSNSNVQPSQAPTIDSQHHQTSQVSPVKPVDSAASMDAEINSIVDSLASAGDLGSCAPSKITSAVASAVSATKNESLLTPNKIASMATSAAHQMTSQAHPINSAASQASHATSTASATSSHSAANSQTSANTSYASQATSQNTNTSYASQASQVASATNSAANHASQTTNNQAPTTSAQSSVVSASNSQASHAKQPTSAATNINSSIDIPAQSAIAKPSSVAKSAVTSQAIKSNASQAVTSVK